MDQSQAVHILSQMSSIEVLPDPRQQFSKLPELLLLTSSVITPGGIVISFWGLGLGI